MWSEAFLLYSVLFEGDEKPTANRIVVVARRARSGAGRSGGDVDDFPALAGFFAEHFLHFQAVHAF